MSAIQKNFVEAMDLFINSQTSLTDIIGNRYGFNKMEQGSEFPYLVYTWVGNNLTRDSVDNFENPIIEISLFSNENAPTEILNLKKIVTDIFDNAELNVVGFTTLKFIRTNDFSGASTEVWDEKIRFNTEFQEV